MSKLFDDIKNDYLRQEIPDNIDMNIDNLLDNLPNLNKKDFIILFVGRLAEEKNIEFLIN